jgi:Lrp/AsnC family leucine-responsive transcriptional regulator
MIGKSSAEPVFDLDAIDRKILQQLQRDNRIANQDLARAVGLSPPACLKRVRRLRETGVILGDVSIVDPRALGYSVMVLARLSLDRPREDLVRAFERKVRELPEVIQCWMVAGDTDLVLLVCAKSLDAYQSFARNVLGSELNLRDYRSDIVLASIKPLSPVPTE